MNSYDRIYNILIEGVVKVTHPSGRTFKVTPEQAAARRAHPKTRREPQKPVGGAEATLGTTAEIKARSKTLKRILRSPVVGPRQPGATPGALK